MVGKKASKIAILKCMDEAYKTGNERTVAKC